MSLIIFFNSWRPFLIRDGSHRIIKLVHELNRYGFRRKPLQHSRLDLSAVGVLHFAFGFFLNRAKEEGCYELFLLELGTGMRRGEILALKWSDLNFTTGELRIERQINVFNGEQIISEPKTKASIRTIILPPSLLQILSEYKETVDSE